MLALDPKKFECSRDYIKSFVSFMRKIKENDHEYEA
jgi:hypothetical protein